MLDLDATATPDELSKRYRHLAKVHHPDRCGGDGARMKELTAAYNVITDCAGRSASASMHSGAQARQPPPRHKKEQSSAGYQYAQYPGEQPWSFSDAYKRAGRTPRLEVQAMHFRTVWNRPSFDEEMFQVWAKKNFKSEHEALAYVFRDDSQRLSTARSQRSGSGKGRVLRRSMRTYLRIEDLQKELEKLAGPMHQLGVALMGIWLVLSVTLYMSD